MTNITENRDWKHRARRRLVSVAVAAGIGLLPLIAARVAAQAPAPTYSVLYNFSGHFNGDLPHSGLIADSSGHLYGTTQDGGIVSSSCYGACGVVFQVDLLGNEKVLYRFARGNGGVDGAIPFDSLVRDSAGNLYGTTTGGGNSTPSCPNTLYGCGVVFKLDPLGHETVLHTFVTVPGDGATPIAGLILDSAGTLYGTTQGGGNSTCDYGCGVVFSINSAGHYKVLYRFTGGADGADPQGGLIRDSAGNLYGTTESGGSCPFSSYGCGVVFKLDPLGNETVLYTFKGGADGFDPRSALIRDSAGNFYGTTFQGGISGSSCPNGAQGCGVVFKLDPQGNETVLYTFTGGADGSDPLAGLIRDSAGNLFGTTWYGGASGNSCNYGCGVVFKVDPLGNETVLHSFTGGADGSSPYGGLLAYQGSIYGTSVYGGTYDGGVVFKIQP